MRCKPRGCRPGWHYGLVRMKNVLVGLYYYRMARRYPQQGQGAAWSSLVGDALGPHFDVAAALQRRSYKPWDQRVCLVPDGDLFQQPAQRAARRW